MPLNTCWTHPCGPDGQLTMTLHVYKPIRFQWAWFGVNPPSGQWLLSSGICKIIPGAFITPMGTLMWAQWANDHDVAHLQVKMVPMNFIWMNPPSGGWVPVSARFQECLLYPWTHPCGPDGQMTMTLHIYSPRQFQWSWFGMNLPVVAVFQCLQDSRSPYYTHGWLCPRVPDGQITMMLDIYRPIQFRWV